MTCLFTLILTEAQTRHKVAVWSFLHAIIQGQFELVLHVFCSVVNTYVSTRRTSWGPSLVELSWTKTIGLQRPIVLDAAVCWAQLCLRVRTQTSTGRRTR